MNSSLELSLEQGVRDLSGRTVLGFDGTMVEASANRIEISACILLLEWNGRFAFTYSDLRRQWELPEARREPGEAFAQCVARVLCCEIGQFIDDLEFAGVARMKVTGCGIIRIAVLHAMAEQLDRMGCSPEHGVVTFFYPRGNEADVETAGRDIIACVKAQRPDLAGSHRRARCQV